VACELFGRFDPAYRAPRYPEGTAAESDGRIFLHLDPIFFADQVRARIYLDDGLIVCTYPDEPSTDRYGGLTNGTGFDSSNKVAALTVNSLNPAIAFGANPDRPLPCRQGTRIGMEVDCRSDPIGSQINAIEFVVSCPGDPDRAEGDDDARA
jgi:hypothetical protein